MKSKPLARRQFLKMSAGTLAYKKVADYILAIVLLTPIEEPKEA